MASASLSPSVKPQTFKVLDKIDGLFCKDEVLVRLLHFWEARSFKKGNVLMGVEFLLLDSESKGIEKLFPIQKAVLEPAMQGRDMIGRARTGTGKTLAFGIPIIDKIIKFNAKQGRGRNPLCLVLAPTRELARQVEKEFRESAPSLDTICVYGGTPIGQQMRQPDYGVDIAVGTPGLNSNFKRRRVQLMQRDNLRV